MKKWDTFIKKGRDAIGAAKPAQGGMEQNVGEQPAGGEGVRRALI